MNQPIPAPPSIASALRGSVSATAQAGRELGTAIRAAIAAVRAAASEDRGVVRSICAATEHTARIGIRVARELKEQNISLWRPLPIVGVVARACITVVTWACIGILSGLVIAMIACDVLLNTARTERVG